jgi:preprotein translocase subunit SecB
MTETSEKQLSLLSLTIPVASKVQIKKIRLLNTKADCDLSEISEGLRVNFGFDSEVSLNETEKTITVKSTFQTFAHKGEEADINKAPIRIQGEFELEYSIDSLDQIKQENINAFGQMNGIHNAWPYWREYVQSMTVRMGLPPLTLPVITGAFLENYYKEQKEKESQKTDSVETAISDAPLSAGQSKI